MYDQLWICLIVCLEFNVGRWWVISLINLPSYLIDGSHAGLLHLWNSRITLTCDTSMLYATSSFVTFYPFTYQIIFDLCIVNSLGEFKTHSKYSMHSLPSFHLWIVSKNISLSFKEFPPSVQIMFGLGAANLVLQCSELLLPYYHLEKFI
jgi:hypothetical protein